MSNYLKRPSQSLESEADHPRMEVRRRPIRHLPRLMLPNPMVGAEAAKSRCRSSQNLKLFKRIRPIRRKI